MSSPASPGLEMTLISPCSRRTSKLHKNTVQATMRERLNMDFLKVGIRDRVDEKTIDINTITNQSV